MFASISLEAIPSLFLFTLFCTRSLELNQSRFFLFDRHCYLTSTDWTLKPSPIPPRMKASVYRCATLRALGVSIAVAIFIFSYVFSLRHRAFNLWDIPGHSGNGFGGEVRRNATLFFLNRISKFAPARPTAVHRDHILVAHALERICCERRAKPAATI